MRFYLGLSLLLGVLFAEMPFAYAQPTIGEGVPDFTLTSTQEEAHRLSDYQGKFVVLEWVNYDCPFVRKHYDSGNMQTLQKKYTAKEVIWLSICSSAPGKQGHYTADEWNPMIQDKGASPTAVLLDADGEVGHLYGARTTPHMYVIDPEGTLLYMGAIDDFPSTRSVDVEKAQNYVSSALDEALSGEEVSTSLSQPYGCSVKY
jgi:alkyl hydroperoxide reductase subunit AhpC